MLKIRKNFSYTGIRNSTNKNCNNLKTNSLQVEKKFSFRNTTLELEIRGELK